MTEKAGDRKVRSHFRTREGTGEERLPTRKCGQCGREQYQVPVGMWLHWTTLGEGCPIAVSEGQEGAISGSGDLDTGEGVS